MQLGDQPAAEAAIAKFNVMVGDAGAIRLVQVYAQWGRSADAVRWLHKAYDLRDPGLAELKVLPWIESIRGTRDYRDIMAKLDFPS